MGSKPQRFWVIRGYDSAQLIFERRLPLGSLSEREVGQMLQRLAARDLTCDEVVRSSLRKRAKGYIGHLEIHRDARRAGGFCLMTTGNPHFTATAEEGPAAT